MLRRNVVGYNLPDDDRDVVMRCNGFSIEYVGVSPKWVIRRYRLHELIERFNSGEKLDWAQLALVLGYFDQAHLINDFTTIIGYSPTQYRKLVSKEA